MSKVFEDAIDTLSIKSGYDYDFLIDVYNEIFEDSGDVDMKYFTDVTMEHDW